MLPIGTSFSLGSRGCAEMAVRVSIGNPKGGVGKSTTAMMLAEGLAIRFGARVLVLDMDPQAMATKILIGQQALHEYRSQDRGLSSLLRAWAKGARTDISRHIVPASDMIELRDRSTDSGSVDLVPSDPELLKELGDLQVIIGRLRRKQRLDAVLATLLGEELSRIDRSYNVIIFDCPAGPVPLALTSFRLSNHVLVPTNLEQNSYSTLVDFWRLILSEDLGLSERLRVHILVTMYQSINPVQRQMLDHIRAGAYELNAIYRPIPLSTALQRAQLHPGSGAFRSSREKYEAAIEEVVALADTMFDRLEFERAS